MSRDMKEDISLAADLRAFSGLKTAEHFVLHRDDVKAVNTEEKPDASRRKRSGAASWTTEN